MLGYPWAKMTLCYPRQSGLSSQPGSWDPGSLPFLRIGETHRRLVSRSQSTWRLPWSTLPQAKLDLRMQHEPAIPVARFGAASTRSAASFTSFVVFVDATL